MLIILYLVEILVQQNDSKLLMADLLCHYHKLVYMKRMRERKALLIEYMLYVQ